MGQSIGLIVALFVAVAVPSFAATKDAAPPDKEMLRMMDFLREMELMQQMEMMRELSQLEQQGEPRPSGPGPKSSPTNRKGAAK